MTTDTTGTPTVGWADHGRRMTLAEFENARGAEGRIYELSRGEVIVRDVADPPHGIVICALRQQFEVYRSRCPGAAHMILSAGERKLLIEPTQSERHPDLALYKTPAPAEDASAWPLWVPEIVIEVVADDSEHSDYVEK